MLRSTDPLDFRPAQAADPDVVVILLGTNDSKLPGWTQHQGEFVHDYVAAVKAFQALPSHPRVWAGLPVPAFPGNWGITEEVVRDGVIPAIAKAAQEAGIPTIDLHTPLLGAKARFPDLVHPDVAGAKRIAELVAAAIAPPNPPR